MVHTFEIYPDETIGNRALYFIEFKRWSDKDPLTWQLFKRNYMYSEEEWKFMLEKMPEKIPWLSRECHPWNLGEGVVIENENVMNMNTKSFLKFLADSLNKNSEQ